MFLYRSVFSSPKMLRPTTAVRLKTIVWNQNKVSDARCGASDINNCTLAVCLRRGHCNGVSMFKKKKKITMTVLNVSVQLMLFVVPHIMLPTHLCAVSVRSKGTYDYFIRCIVLVMYFYKKLCMITVRFDVF